MMEGIRVAGNDRFSEGRYDDAEKLYGEALEAGSSDPDADNSDKAVVHGNRSLARFKLQRFEGALRDAEEAIKLDELYVKGHHLKAIALIGLGRKREARTCYANAIEFFTEKDVAEAKPFMEFFERQLRMVCKDCAEEDKTKPIETLEEFVEISKFMPTSDLRLRLATMATFWNTSSKSERMAIFSEFIFVLTGSHLEEGIQSEDSLVELPMENYEDITIPETWVEFYKSLPVDQKVHIFDQFYKHCSDSEKNLIARDLKEFFPKPT